MASIFEKIASREIPGYIIWESANYLAFLDINPLTKGHTLVVPKANIGDELFELDEDHYVGLMKASKKVASLLKQKLGSLRIIMIVEGFEVPHVHVKLVPMDKRTPTDQLPKIEFSKKDFLNLVELIKSDAS